MSYIRPMGDAVTSTTEVDGPITSPSQVPWTPSTDDVYAGTIGANRVDCTQLPADSPWRKPGQACAPTGGILDTIGNLLTSARDAISGAAGAAVTAAPTPPSDAGTPWLLIAGASGIAAYLLLKKKKKSA
jgi:LPXTG-motif cell wall-anchored protein